MSTKFVSNGSEVGTNYPFVPRLVKIAKEATQIAMNAESTTSLGFKLNITDLTSGGAIAVSANKCVLKTKASAGAYAAIKSKDTYTAAKIPEALCVINLASVDNIEARAGLYKDSDEYFEVKFNATAGDTTWKAVIHNATGSEVVVDTGITADTGYQSFEFALSATGIPYLAVDGNEITLSAAFKAKLLPGACNFRTYVKALAAGAEVVNVYNWAQAKNFLVTLPNQC